MAREVRLTNATITGVYSPQPRAAPEMAMSGSTEQALYDPPSSMLGQRAQTNDPAAASTSYVYQLAATLLNFISLATYPICTPLTKAVICSPVVSGSIHSETHHRFL